MGYLIGRLILAIFVLTSGTIGGQPIWCPAKCLCSENNLSVTCKNIKLKRIQPDLPPFINSLDLTNNQISEICNNTFIWHQNLMKLILTDNRITTIEVGAFNGLVNLAELSLKLNRLNIDVLEASVFVQEHLPSIYLSNVYFRHKAVPKLIFRNITTLTKLHLSNSRLQAIPEGAFYGLENLFELFLDGLMLDALDENVFSGLNSLITLNLKNNQLRVINPSTFSRTLLQKITKLYLAGN
ncbi:hypothetical protein CAPTEDRAFT_103906, partial [Capitella teleta]